MEPVPGKRHTEDLVDTLYQISRLVGKTTDPQHALQEILKQIALYFQASSASILLVNPDTHELELEAIYGQEMPSQPLSLKIGEGITGYVAATGDPLFIPDVRNDPRYHVLHPEVVCEMAAPLIERNNVIGVVNVEGNHPDRFTIKDLKTLALFTHEASQVVASLWNINRLQERSKQLESLLRFGQRLAFRRSPEAVVRETVVSLNELLHVPLSMIWEFDPDKEELHLLDQEGEFLQPDKFPFHIRISTRESVLSVPSLRFKPIELQRLAYSDDEFLAFLSIREKLSSMLAVPILYQDEIIGVLTLFTRNHHRFSNEERDLISTLANLHSVAWQNSLLYSKVSKSENKLRKNEKLTTMGLLAAEVAHEIRNPLTVLQLLIQNLALTPKSPEEAEDFRIVLDKIEQLEHIVSRILSFSKPDSTPHLPVHIEKLIQDTLALMRLKLEQSSIAVQWNPPRQLPAILGNTGQLQQVFLNLFLNALEAMPKGGILSVRITVDKDLRVEISDTGNGIPQEVLHHIWHSFLTEKTTGTGLGLAVVKQILHNHQGDIQVTQTGESGTTFEIRLPL